MATTWRQSRRVQRTLVTLAIFVCGAAWAGWTQLHQQQPASQPAVKSSTQTVSTGQAADALTTLPVKGRAPMTGYARTAFGPGWATVGGCDMREHILGRDLTGATYRSATDCTVLSGTLRDPYTDKTIPFTRGTGTSDAVQIDHVVAIGNAWQTGAQALTPAERTKLYNDPLELLAVDGPTNEQKGDGDAATWLPPNTAYRCRYVARQVAVKQAYHLWVTQAEHDAIQRVLATCPGQQLPTVN
ncbi:MAG TPA: HNH endonuclease family protein [Candidatus Saccharimonadales bacterium]|nr:HNH endonuclease family protein [Candidatus Saccharimonadales bacterium]